MKTEEDITQAEAELVEEPQSLVRATPTTIEQLAASQDGIQIVERGIAIMKALRAASIALTFPHDWVLFKADERVTGYLQDSGCQRVKDLWGIEILDIEEFIRTEDPDTKDFSYSITGTGFSKRTSQTVERVTGTRYSYEDFIVRRNLKKLQVETEVKKAARANLDGTIVRELAGLKAVPAEELDEVWTRAGMNTYKTTKLSPKGRGFGSQAERQGAQVQQADDLQPGEEPFCEDCQRAGKTNKMKFVQGGVSSRTGKPYSSFWSCPVRDSNHKAIQHSDYMKQVHDRRDAKTSQREPGAEG